MLLIYHKYCNAEISFVSYNANKYKVYSGYNIITDSHFIIKQSRMMNTIQYCQYCGKQALSMCSQCKVAAYCSRQHQLEHWRIHKQHCNLLNSYRLRTQQTHVHKKRLQLRKKYFESFMHRVFDSCIKTAQEMAQLESQHIHSTKQVFNELQYGISMCLLARSWLNIKNQAKAYVVINGYMEQKIHFLKDMRDVGNFDMLNKGLKKRKNIQTQQTMVQSFRKGSSNLVQSPLNVHPSLKNTTIANNLNNPSLIVTLLSSVANILHSLKLPTVALYEIYTQHIEKMFGKDSYEVSNCYFMVGSYYMQNHQYYKSIACFIRAAEFRGNIGGDCYYNLGILFQFLRKPRVSLMMFQNAAKLRETQFGENSSEVADVYHNIALIYQSQGNFKGAIQNLQKIALIYSKDKSSQQYANAKQSIKHLEQAFRKHMQKDTNLGMIGTGLFNDLKKTIRKASKIPQDSLSQVSYRSSDRDKEGDGEKRKKIDQANNFLRLSEQFLKKLNPLQSLHLSELQIQLGQCDTIFMASTVVGASPFLKSLKAKKLQDLMKQNQFLFKNIQIEMLSKRGIRDHNSLE